MIISPFSGLFCKQYYSKKCIQINPEFAYIKQILFYANPYTFFNRGLHNNILETCEFIYNDILKHNTTEYDTVVISCGAYSTILAKKFYDINKNVLTIGNDITILFGILNQRSKEQYKGVINPELWITEIPEKYKPKDYKRIENGCYW